MLVNVAVGAMLLMVKVKVVDLAALLLSVAVTVTVVGWLVPSVVA